jgi:hypothetical protein
VPAAWVASMYGGTANSKIFNNTIIRSASAKAGFKPFRMGWSERDDCIAKNVEFRSNNFQGTTFDLQVTDQPHSYSVYWTLTINAVDAEKKPMKNTEVTIADANNAIAFRGKTDSSGVLKTELLEYTVKGKEKIISSPYTISAAGIKKEIYLDSNRQITCIINK